MEDWRPGRAGVSAEDASGSDRRAASEHGGADAGSAGADGREERAGKHIAGLDTGPVAGGEARERTAMAGGDCGRYHDPAAVHVDWRSALYDVFECELNIGHPAASTVHTD